MDIKLRDGRKWLIEVTGSGRTHLIAIPPKDIGERIDFIDRNWHYHYNYKGVISRGIVIIINDGQAKLKEIPHFTMKRLTRYILDNE